MNNKCKSRSFPAELTGLVLALSLAGSAGAVTSIPPELQHAHARASANFKSSRLRWQAPPFSFVYDGKPSAKLLKRWKFIVGPITHDAGKRVRQFTYLDAATGLEVICEVKQYEDAAAVEWVLHFKNTGTKPTPILEDVRALDTGFVGGS
jgi:hypothetical protein